MVVSKEVWRADDVNFLTCLNDVEFCLTVVHMRSSAAYLRSSVRGST